MARPRRRAERSALKISQLCIRGNNIHEAKNFVSCGVISCDCAARNRTLSYT